MKARDRGEIPLPPAVPLHFIVSCTLTYYLFNLFGGYLYVSFLPKGTQNILRKFTE